MGDKPDGANAHGCNNSVTEVETSNCFYLARRKKSNDNEEGANGDDTPSTITVKQPTNQKTSERMDKSKKGKNSCRGGTAPAKFIQDGYEENRK